jgi:hypothetical protein
VTVTLPKRPRLAIHRSLLSSLKYSPPSSTQSPHNPKPAASSSASADKSKAFPDTFLWGCATAGHQVEGNNTAAIFG